MSNRLLSSDSVKALCACLFCAPMIYAETGHQHGDKDTHVSEQTTHLHGHAELMLGLDQGSLEINFASPAVNLVGFEHRARNGEEVSALKNAQAVLQEANKIFSFEGGNCQLASVDVDIASLLDVSHGEPQMHQERHGDEHSDTHKKHAQAQHDTHGEHKAHQERHGEKNLDVHKSHSEGQKISDSAEHESHNEILAEYRYQCESGDELSALAVHLAELFPAIEKLKVVWLTENKQGAVDLTGQSNLVNFR